MGRASSGLRRRDAVRELNGCNGVGAKISAIGGEPLKLLGRFRGLAGLLGMAISGWQADGPLSVVPEPITDIMPTG